MSNDVNKSASPNEFRLVDIREVWPGEAREFTPWLADNLEALGEHIEVGQLSLVSTEVQVPGGRRSLDILAEDSDGRKWAIENQYGELDHDHLTRALAYAVGLECRAVVVVAESHREEFIAVADEWNRYSEAYGRDGIRLFLAAIEVGRIGDSPPGYRFRLVAGPNEWKSETATGQKPSSDADQIREKQRNEFWTGLFRVVRQKGNLSPSVTSRTVSNWVSLRTRGPFSFTYNVLVNSCRVELQIYSSDGDRNNELFDALHAERDAIQEGLGTEVEWINDPRHQTNRIVWVPEGACGYRSPPEQRQAGYEVLADALYRFYGQLMPRVERLV